MTRLLLKRADNSTQACRNSVVPQVSELIGRQIVEMVA